MRRLQLCRRLEIGTINLQGVVQHGWRKVRGKCVGQTQLSSKAGAIRTRTEDPQGDVAVGAGYRTHALALGYGPEKHLQFENVLGEGVRAGGAAAQSPQGKFVGAGGPAKPEIDSSGEQGIQSAKLLGNDQGSMVGQHDTAGTDPDGFTACCDVRNDDGSCGAGNTRHVVMFGNPKALVTPGLGVGG